MTLQDLGAIGEFLGFVAVLITLVYLAIQTKQARLAAQESAKHAGLQATHSIIDIYTRWRNTLLSDPSYPEVIAKANRSEPLTDAEQVVLSLIFHDLFYGASFSYASAVFEGSIHESPADVEYTVSILKEMPCGVAEWNRWKTNVSRMSREFVELVDRELEDAGAG